MKKNFKIVSALIIGALLIMPVTTFASDMELGSGEEGNLSNIGEAVRQLVTAEYKQSEEFRQNMKEDPESAMQMLDYAVLKEMQSLTAPRGGDQGVAYCYVPDIWQLPNQCGAASCYQAIGGAGYTDNIPGSSTDDKIATLWASVQDDKALSSVVWKITRDLNTYVPGGNYTYKLGGSETESKFALDVAHSLIADHPVILHALTDDIVYYQGHKSRHYICVQKIDRNINEITVMDCNNDSTYHGEHTMTIKEALKSVSYTNRYYIYG